MRMRQAAVMCSCVFCLVGLPSVPNLPFGLRVLPELAHFCFALSPCYLGGDTTEIQIAMPDRDHPVG